MLDITLTARHIDSVLSTPIKRYTLLDQNPWQLQFDFVICISAFKHFDVILLASTNTSKVRHHTTNSVRHISQGIKHSIVPAWWHTPEKVAFLFLVHHVFHRKSITKVKLPYPIKSLLLQAFFNHFFRKSNKECNCSWKRNIRLHGHIT